MALALEARELGETASMTQLEALVHLCGVNKGRYAPMCFKESGDCEGSQAVVSVSKSRGDMRNAGIFHVCRGSKSRPWSTKRVYQQ